MGNIRALIKSFAQQGFDVRVVEKGEDLRQDSHIVLPGRGSFGDAMRELNQRNLIEPIHEHIDAGKPFLAIGVGLEVLMSGCDDKSGGCGLGIIPGVSRRLQSSNERIPHRGWERIQIMKRAPILQGVATRPIVYFDHTCCVEPEESSVVAAVSEFDQNPINAIIWRDNIFGTQFYPEKSRPVGIKILERFGKIDANN